MSLKSLCAAFGCASILASSLASAKPGPTSGPDKAACVAALDDAQAARAASKLLDARARYVTCSHEACPDMLREDCSKGLREVNEALPSIVLSASVDGKDTTDAIAILDGERVADTLDGRAIPVDPGPHVARFEVKGEGPIEVRVVAREGEKNRLVTGTFVLTKATIKKPADKPIAEGSRFPVLPVAFATAGLLSIGGGIYTHIAMIDRANELGRTCAPNCEQADRDSLSDKLVLRNVALGVGVGALAVAAVTYLVSRR